jgi:hypothetical protein
MKSAGLFSGTAVAAATILATALSAPAQAATTRSTTRSDAVSSQCGPASFDAATVTSITSGTAGTLTLVVTGTKTSTNVTIDLVPVIYIQQPVYWEIDVIGCTSGIGLPVLTPYTAKLDVTNTVGKLGIEVVGSNKSVLIPVVPALGG